VKKYLFCSAVILLLLSRLASSQRQISGQQVFRRNLEQLMEVLQQLDLSLEQRTKLQTLRQETRQKIQALRRAAEDSRDFKGWREKLAQLQQETYQQFLQILNEDQRLELALRLSLSPEEGEDRSQTVEELALLLKEIPERPALPAGYFSPYEQESSYPVAGEIDRLVRVSLRKEGLEPAPICSDEVFIRRVYLDVTGKLPTPVEVLEFLKDSRTDKRSRLIESLLNRDEYVDYWTMRWGDLLRIKAEFPINLWPNAAAVYHRWVRQAVSDNLPYDLFVRKLLTASGSNFREPPVNFFRAVQERSPAALAEAAALTFMGTRLSSWPEKDRKVIEIFFSRVGYKKTAEWKEEIVYWKREPLPVREVVMPDGQKVSLPPEKDPRIVFAEWLVRKDNPWFTRAIANRVWYWFFGRGLVQEVDDLRSDNPPVNPALLEYLASQLVQARYDLKHLYRLILNSRTYQQSSLGRHPASEKFFACYPVRRLEAEVLEDIFRQVFRVKMTYSSDIPEPFTYIPEEQNTVSLYDGSITSPFLITFGRPPRDTGLASERNMDVTENQRLFFINSSRLNEWIRSNRFFQAISGIPRHERKTVFNLVWLILLSRLPTGDELLQAQQYFDSQKSQNEALLDLVWALVNTREFSCRH